MARWGSKCSECRVSVNLKASTTLWLFVRNRKGLKPRRIHQILLSGKVLLCCSVFFIILYEQARRIMKTENPSIRSTIFPATTHLMRVAGIECDLLLDYRLRQEPTLLYSRQQRVLRCSVQEEGPHASWACRAAPRTANTRTSTGNQG